MPAVPARASRGEAKCSADAQNWRADTGAHTRAERDEGEGCGGEGQALRRILDSLI
jgi:hypothetical protein